MGADFGKLNHTVNPSATDRALLESGLSVPGVSEGTISKHEDMAECKASYESAKAGISKVCQGQIESHKEEFETEMLMKMYSELSNSPRQGDVTIDELKDVCENLNIAPKTIQRVLLDKGLYSGAIDGVIGAGSTMGFNKMMKDKYFHHPELQRWRKKKINLTGTVDENDGKDGSGGNFILSGEGVLEKGDKYFFQGFPLSNENALSPYIGKATPNGEIELLVNTEQAKKWGKRDANISFYNKNTEIKNPNQLIISFLENIQKQDIGEAVNRIREQGPLMIKGVQGVLKKAGFYTGPIDGDFGRGSVAAYEARGVAKNKTTKSTEQGVKLQVLTPEAVETEKTGNMLARLEELSYKEVLEKIKNIDKSKKKSLQIELKDVGFYNGPIDGLIGEGSKKALNKYLRDRHEKKVLEKIAGMDPLSDELLYHGQDALKEPEKTNFKIVMKKYGEHIRYSIIKHESKLKGKGPKDLLAFVKGIIDTESSYKEVTTDGLGSHGLMQVRVGSTKTEIINRYGINTTASTKNNLEGGIAYVFDLIGEFGLENGLSAYNLGPTAYRKKRRTKPTSYAHKVLGDMRKYL